MKKLLAIMLALIMVLAMVPALADDPTSGNCGASGNEASVTWKLEQNNTDTANPTYTLTISGNGAMADYNGWRLQPWKGYAEKITKFVVEDGVTVIGRSATDGENKIAEYTIGKDVKTINNYGISTYSATTFNLNGNPHFNVVDGVLFSADGKTIYAYPGGKTEEIEVYNVPSDVTRINGGAFNGAKIKKLIFGGNSIDIGSWGFQDCTAVYMELNGTHLSGSESFRGLSKLKHLKIDGGNIPGQFFCGVHSTGGASTAAIEKISISELPTISGNNVSGPFFLQYKLTTVDLSQCSNVGNASAGLFCDTGYTVKSGNTPTGKRISKITFYFNTADDAESFKSTSTDAYESTNAVFAVLNGGSIPSTEGWYNGKEKYIDGDGLEIEEGQFVLATPERPGYNFAGWYTNADFSGDAVTTVEEAGSTYYAKWTEKPIRFDANGGTGTMPNENYIVRPETNTEPLSYSIIFPECTFTAPDGKEFAGWKITAPNQLVDNTVYPAGGEKNIGKEEVYLSVTVTAQWKDKPQEQQPSGGGNGGGYWHPTTTPVPVIVIPPKTGDMTVWQSILHFLGIR